MAQTECPTHLLPEHKVIVSAAASLDLTFLEPVLSQSLPAVNIPELLEEYKKFLAIKVIAGDTSEPLLLSPSALVDQAWHAHLLSTASYSAACSALGAVIHHTLTGAQDLEMVRRKRMEMTKSFYLMIFHCSPPRQFWRAEFSQNKGGGGGSEAETENNNIKAKKSVALSVQEKIQVHVIFPNGKKLTVVCKPNLQVESLFKKVVEESGIEAHQLKLIYDGMRMQRDERLCDYMISDGSIVEMYLIHSGC